MELETNRNKNFYHCAVKRPFYKTAQNQILKEKHQVFFGNTVFVPNYYTILILHLKKYIE